MVRKDIQEERGKGITTIINYMVLKTALFLFRGLRCL